MFLRRALFLAVACLGLALTGSSAFAQRKNPDALKVLILSGGQREHHAFREQAFYLSNLLEDTKRYRVTITEDAAILETPAFSSYDILIVPSDRRDPDSKLSPSRQEAIFSFVKSGHGYVSIHGGDNAPADWLPEWREMLGGIFSHQGLPDGKTRKGSYTVKIVDREHPVAKGLADFDIKDELYYQIQMQPDVKPIASVRYQDQDWPVAWTREYGSGRVFHTPLGHQGWKDPQSDDPLRDPNLSRLVLQGVDWVAESRKK